MLGIEYRKDRVAGCEGLQCMVKCYHVPFSASVLGELIVALFEVQSDDALETRREGEVKQADSASSR